MKKVMSILIAIMFITTSISVAEIKTLQLKEIVTNPRILKNEVAKVGPYVGQITYYSSSQVGVYSSIRWTTREKITWVNLEKEILKEFVGIDLTHFDKGIIYKNYKITKYSDKEFNNGKVTEVKGLSIHKMPNMGMTTPKYLLENTSKLYFLESVGPRWPFGCTYQVPYLDQTVAILTVVKEEKDFRVKYEFVVFNETDESLLELWNKLSLAGTPEPNVIVNKDGFKYLFSIAADGHIVLTVAKSNSSTFDKYAFTEVNDNNTKLEWDKDGLIFKEDEMAFRSNKEFEYESYKITATDIPGIIKGKPSTTLIKFSSSLTPQGFWEIFKKKYDVVGDVFPIKYMRLGEYEVKIDNQNFYIRKYVDSSSLMPWYLVISNINDSYNPEQMSRKGNILVLENYNLSGYNCRVELAADGKNKNESVATYYINTSDSVATVWSTFTKHFQYEDYMVGKFTDKNFKLKVTGLDGTFVYTKLYKKTENQVIIKSSR